MPTNPVPVPALPSWTDAPSVTSYITSIIVAVFSVIAFINPGTVEPAQVKTIVPVIGLLIASGVQVFNLVTHRSVQKAAIAANAGK